MCIHMNTTVLPVVPSFERVSLAEVTGGGFDRDAPGIEKAGIDIINHSNPRHWRMGSVQKTTTTVSL